MYETLMAVAIATWGTYLVSAAIADRSPGAERRAARQRRARKRERAEANVRAEIERTVPRAQAQFTDEAD